MTGLKPFKKDHRDRSFPATFGSTTDFPRELDLDAGFGFPDQDALGFPEGCTGFTQSEICQDLDKRKYNPDYTYKKTLMMMNAPAGSPCDIRQSLKSTIVYGVQSGTETDEQAGTHRRGAYYNVVDETALDSFDDIRSALVKTNSSISFATPWYDEWNHNPIILKPWSKSIGGHNLKISGWRYMGGEPYLLWKTWQGGDYKLVSRETFNALMPQALAFTIAPYHEGDFYRVKLAMLETVLSYLRILLHL